MRIYAINNYISCAIPIDDICIYIYIYIIYGDTVKNLCAKYLSKPFKKLRFFRLYCCHLILESIGNVHLKFSTVELHVTLT